MRGTRDTILHAWTRSRIVAIALFVFALLLGNAALNMYARYKEARVRADRAQEELNDLATRKKILEEDLTRLETPRGLEEELRKRFDVAAEGEKVIVVVDQKNTEDGGGASQEKTVWQKIVHFFSRGR